MPGADFLSASIAQFRQRWKYNRGFPLQKSAGVHLLGTQWENHEVVNDFAGPFEPLMPFGRKAYLEYHPISRSRSESYRIYRKFRWGKVLELFALDNRQYRSSNQQSDRDAKSMLGRGQLKWLVGSLSQSDAVWKIIAASVPLPGELFNFGRICIDAQSRKLTAEIRSTPTAAGGDSAHPRLRPSTGAIVNI